MVRIQSYAAFAVALLAVMAWSTTTAGAQQVDDPEVVIDSPVELDEADDAPAALSTDDLSKELANPNSPLAKLSFDTTFTLFEGNLPDADGQVAVTSLFQPIFPFPVTDDGTVNLFVRPGIPIIWNQPVPNIAAGRFDNIAGIGDIGYDLAIGKTFDNGLVVVGGIQGTLPTGTDSRLTGGQYRLGPEGALAYITDVGFLSAFPQHQWNIGGWRDDAYSRTRLELSSGIYLDGGWTILTNPKIDYDWVDEQWTVPINLSVRKVVQVGNTPMQIQGKVDYFVERNDAFGPEWAFTLNVTPIIPNFIYNAIAGN